MFKLRRIFTATFTSGYELHIGHPGEVALVRAYLDARLRARILRQVFRALQYAEE